MLLRIDHLNFYLNKEILMQEVEAYSCNPATWRRGSVGLLDSLDERTWIIRCQTHNIYVFSINFKVLSSLF